MLHMSFLRLCIFLFMVHLSTESIVSTAQGRIRGIEHEGYVSFIGIPYASVSGYGGRFKRAGIAPTWSGVRESDDPYCTTRSDTQDCLQLDVHVPRAGAPWPVLVWVKGSSGDYHPEKLVKQGIIVVIVRHRMGPVGFLCSKEDKVPGNAGVKDIVLALRWVRDNIVAFKGNSDRVVVAGQSLGAAMVEALTLSPMAKGLYNGAIIQSGSILAPWAFNYDANDRTQYLQMMLNGSDTLFKSSIMDLVEISEELDLPYFPFGMCTEKPMKNEESLLSEAPFDVLIKGKMNPVPMIVGYNTNEAYVFVSMLQDIQVLNKMARDATFLLPMEFQSMSDREIKSIMKQIMDMYFKDNIMMSSVLEYHRDAYFLSHIHRSANLHARHGPVYYYQFSYSGSVGVEPEPGEVKSGAAHSDELAYLFPTTDMDFDGDDVAVHQHLIQLWTSFVKNLKPSSGDLQWDTLDPHQPRLLDINTDLVMIDFPLRREMDMWEDLYEKYYFRRH